MLQRGNPTSVWPASRSRTVRVVEDCGGRYLHSKDQKDCSRRGTLPEGR